MRVIGVLCFGERAHRLIPLVLVEETVNLAERDYLSIIGDQLHPYMAYVFANGNGVFQQSCIPCQRTIIMLERLKQHKDECE
ncbi:hypothetical protein TNCV_1966011 [Trichonephila clavipes]|nr:hypothetical protein TNCV_1966011 [Trichonephila clavipes]